MHNRAKTQNHEREKENDLKGKGRRTDLLEQQKYGATDSITLFALVFAFH